jgi:glutamate synthase domain-containing protein 2
MTTGMAYGAALRKRAKVCLAHASSLIDTATNSGESGFLPEGRQAAKKHIVQWNRGRWGNDLTDMAKADAIEIQVGQGAEGSLGTRLKADVSVPILELTWDSSRVKTLLVLPASVISRIPCSLKIW